MPPVFIFRALEDAANLAALVHDGEVRAVQEEVIGHDHVGVVEDGKLQTGHAELIDVAFDPGQKMPAGLIRLVALGRDLRDTVALQRRLIDAQQTMERDYWRFRQAETRYRNLFQSSTEAVLIVDGVTLRVLEANPASLALLETAGAKSPRIVGGGPLKHWFEEHAGLNNPVDIDILAPNAVWLRNPGTRF